MRHDPTADVPVEAIVWRLAPPAPDPFDEDPLVDALLDADAYRLLAQQALHGLHRLRRDYDRLRATHRDLVEEYRRVRVQVLREVGVAR